MPIAWNACTTAQKFALARGLARLVTAARTLVGARNPVLVSRHEIRFELDLSEAIDFCIFVLGVFEPQTHRALGRLVRAGDTVLDIGANFGAHTLHLARMVGAKGQVIAFEPTDYACAKLHRNLLLNPGLADRVALVQAYLVDEPCEQTIRRFYASWRLAELPGQHPKHFGSLASADGARGWTVDGYVATHGIPTVDLIKLDVDGLECSVLRGGRSTLARHRPAIVFELCPYALEEHGASAPELLELLGGLGYGFFRDGSLAPFTTPHRRILDEIKPDSGINVVALPHGVCRWRVASA